MVEITAMSLSQMQGKGGKCPCWCKKMLRHACIYKSMGACRAWNAETAITGGLVGDDLVSILWNKIAALTGGTTQWPFGLGLRPWYLQVTPSCCGLLVTLVCPCSGPYNQQRHGNLECYLDCTPGCKQMPHSRFPPLCLMTKGCVVEQSLSSGGVAQALSCNTL